MSDDTNAVTIVMIEGHDGDARLINKRIRNTDSNAWIVALSIGGARR
jgi:hypothetical protein